MNIYTEIDNMNPLVHVAVCGTLGNFEKEKHMISFNYFT